MQFLRKCDQFLALSFHDKVFFLKSLLGLTTVTVLRRFSSPAAISQYLFKQRINPQGNTSTKHLLQAAYLINAASSSLPFRINCLDCALWMQWIHRYDRLIELRIGVRKSISGALEAHAWIEHDGKIILGKTEGIPYQSLQEL